MSKTTHEQHDTEMLRHAFETLAATSKAMEDAYHHLQEQVRLLHLELEEKNRALEFTADYLGNLLESMNDGVIAVDTQGVVSRFNRAAATILGYAAVEVTGRPFHEVFGRPFRAPASTSSMTLTAKSGRAVPIHERDADIADSDQRRLGSVKVFQDLSELRALQEQARQNDRLAAIGEMAATVAHEIRNPLGGIRGFAAFLAQDLENDTSKKRLVDKILEGANRLDIIVSELLEYTRPVEIVLRPVACSALVEGALAMVKYDTERITLETRLDDGCRALADAEKIHQVLLNIVLNAVQSIEDRGAVSISLTSGVDDVVISVRDTGCGIEKEALQRIFSPFFTTKEKGTGLGLSISAKIVEGHGGRIDVESVPGTGSTVSVHLPRAE